MSEHHIRAAKAADIPHMQDVTRAVGLFPPDIVPDLMHAYIQGSATSHWLIAFVKDQAAGLCFAEAEALTEGTWNMRALGVIPQHQRTGLGTALVRAMEATLSSAGHRLLLVDTSSSEEFAQARTFYDRNAYAEVARIPDYWAQGDHKVTFHKRL